MTASDLLHQHIQTLVDDNARWQTLIADTILWELVYAPSIGHPAQLSGREDAVRHATWFIGAVENFRFFDLKVYPFADPQGAVAEVKAEGLIKATRRTYRHFLMRISGMCCISTAPKQRRPACLAGTTKTRRWRGPSCPQPVKP